MTSWSTGVAGRGAHRAEGMAWARQGGIYGGHVLGLMLWTCYRPSFGDHLTKMVLAGTSISSWCQISCWCWPWLLSAVAANLPKLQLPGKLPLPFQLEHPFLNLVTSGENAFMDVDIGSWWNLGIDSSLGGSTEAFAVGLVALEAWWE